MTDCLDSVVAPTLEIQSEPAGIVPDTRGPGQIPNGSANGQHPPVKAKRRRKVALASVPSDEAAPAVELWQSRLIRNNDGAARDCIENVRLALLGSPSFARKLFYNELRECPVVDTVFWKRTNRLRDWTETDDIDLAAWCQRAGIMAKPATCAAAVQSVAAMFPIHPLRDRLDGLEWDGKERLDGWLSKYLRVAATPYSRTVGRKALIAGAARVYAPGCKVDNMLILEGQQDRGKSTACSVLALDPEWFSDEIADLGSKDSAQDLAGKWLVEISELSAMRRGEVERVKAFISRSVSRYRPSYGRRSMDFSRRCLFIGTTNSDEYLVDPTGNRRFWPVRVGEIDLVALRQDVDQLWAEAVAAYKGGAEWWLSAEEKPAAASQQEARRKVDPWTDRVLEVASDIAAGRDVRIPTVPPTYEEVEGNVTIGKLLDRALDIPIERRDQTASIRVGSILTAAGWVRKQKRTKSGERVRHYVQPDRPTHPVTLSDEGDCDT